MSLQSYIADARGMSMEMWVFFFCFFFFLIVPNKLGFYKGI